MPRKRNTIPAHESFTKLGLAPAVWTDAMRLAHKQRWTNLPVDDKVADLRDRLAAVAPDPVRSVDQLLVDMLASGQSPVTRADAEAEHKRLKRNAGVNAWRERGRLQAALDARELRFAAMRAAKKPAPAPAAGAVVSEAAGLAS